jgi:hypothetical protein
MTKTLICEQCNQVIEDAYLNHNTWIQCFDCYSEQEENFEDITYDNYIGE